MRTFSKALIAAGGVTAASTIAVCGGATAAHADTLSTTADCKPVAAHTEYKWVPDVINAGPTQWSLDNAPVGDKRQFDWKGAKVWYHRDKATQSVSAVNCGVNQPMPKYSTDMCSVTVPYVPGVDTVLYGVNGRPETPITESVTITGSLSGAKDTAPQFWLGYQAKSGYVITNPGAAPTHYDFYNGDYVRDCDGYQSFQMKADSHEQIDLPAAGFKTMNINVNGTTHFGQGTFDPAWDVEGSGNEFAGDRGHEYTTTYTDSAITAIGVHDTTGYGVDLVKEGEQVGTVLYRLDDGPWQPVTDQSIDVTGVTHVWVTYNDRPDTESFADNSGTYDMTVTRTRA